MPTSSPTALTNVRVFDGHQLTALRTVVIEDGRISAKTTAEASIDGAGAALLPGLIDAHVHLHGVESLEQLTEHGVTTALDMACWPPSLVASLRGRPGLTDIRSAGVPAVAPDGIYSRMPGFPPEGIIATPQEAEAFVASQIRGGADYIKLVAEKPGPGGLDQPTLDALVVAAHGHGRAAIAHATHRSAYQMADQAGVDVITHVPYTLPPLTADDARRLAEAGRVTVPTLTMMAGLVQNLPIPGLTYDSALASVSALHAAGVVILAGTDANTAPGAPSPVRHGESLHDELVRLVEAGLSPVEALRATTVLPAQAFQLTDRGVIEPGRRADLLLVNGDPTQQISDTRNIVGVWIAGQQVR